MALLIGISRGKYLQIGNYSLTFLGREKEDERRFLFRLSRPDEPPTELVIGKDDPVCLFGEVIIKVIAESQYSKMQRSDCELKPTKPFLLHDQPTTDDRKPGRIAEKGKGESGPTIHSGGGGARPGKTGKYPLATVLVSNSRDVSYTSANPSRATTRPALTTSLRAGGSTRRF